MKRLLKNKIKKENNDDVVLFVKKTPQHPRDRLKRKLKEKTINIKKNEAKKMFCLLKKFLSICETE